MMAALRAQKSDGNVRGRRSIAMESAFYGFTIVIILVCIAASTSCLSAFVVTRNPIALCFSIAFILYFFDLTFIFQNEYLNLNNLPLQGDALYYSIRDPYLKALVSVGVLESIWLALLEYLNKRSALLAVAPAALFLLAALLIVELLPTGPLKQWLFYSTREAFIVWMIVYVAVQAHRAQTTIQKSRTRKLVRLAAVAAVLCACIVVENTFMIIVWKPSPEVARSTLLLFFSERNISENVFVLLLAAFALRWSFKTLRMRRKDAPAPKNKQDAAYIKATMDTVCERYGLTSREREVLMCLVEGNDYQNTASKLHLALGTVKSHMHNIFKKTGAKTSAELLQMFWGS